ncbi:transcription intermediary factor 1-beta-like [Mytilus californianus]|uniref:transcription intermediary factor 1-beta-like n=1 Tax=Mytilus californianus TaxID=6549 RepID=UPI0022457EBC|nr:transcription intermediary factor 1-beta-like [Mytilus californianus]
MAQCSVRSCEICESSPGRRFCMDCEQFFCKTCELSHLKSKPCRNHVFQDAENANAEVKTPICEQHQEKFTFYCNTCTSLLCNICLPTTHKKHDFCLIDEAASKTRPRLDKEVKSVEGIISRAKQQFISSRLTLKNFEDETDKVKMDIVERMAVIINDLDATKENYLKSVEEHRMKEIRKMNQEIMKIEKATENGLEILDRMKSSIDGQNNIILMDAVSNMTKTLKSASLVSMGTELPARVHFFPYSGKPNAHNLIGNLNFVNPNSGLGFDVEYLPEAEVIECQYEAGEMPVEFMDQPDFQNFQ